MDKSDILGFIQNPVIIIFALIVFLIKNIDKVHILIPDLKKRIEKTIYCLQNTENEKVKVFLNKEKEKYLFIYSSGLGLKKENIELLEYYKDFSEDIEWRKFKDIRLYIFKSGFRSKINTKLVFRKLYARLVGWYSCCALGICTLFVSCYKLNQAIEKDGLINDVISSCFLIVFPLILIISINDKKKSIRKYNEVIENRIH